jgi:hypothetical protein
LPIALTYQVPSDFPSMKGENGRLEISEVQQQKNAQFSERFCMFLGIQLLWSFQASSQMEWLFHFYGRFLL